MRPILGGEFILSSKFVIDRCIEFGGKDFDYREESDAEDDSLISDLSTVDYLCIRCQVEEKASQFEYINKVIEVPCSLKRRQSEGKAQKPRAKFFRRKKVIEVQCSMKSNFTRPNHSSSVKNPYTWVGHGRIVGIKKKKNQQRLIKVIFTLNTISTEIPETFFPTTFGTVEVMFKSVVDRTSMAKVQQIESCPLASSLASNSSPPPLDPKQKATGSRIRVTTIGKFPSNNTKQLEAIRTALTSSFSLIQGPPGTGKTYTGIKLLYLFNKINKEMCEDTDKKKEQVLFCGPSNKSVDLVARLMLEKLGSDCPNIIRVYGTVHESVDYPIPKTTFETKRSLRDIKSDKFLKSVTLHHMVRQEQNSKSYELRRYDRLFSKKPQLVKMSDIRKYKDILFSACCEELSKCDIILCTCAVGGSIKLSVATNICQVVIDECAMSTEPQAMVPIIATKAKQVVLIGDHKQLRPIVQCKEAAELGLATSLFERFAEQATFLDTQYRMHPEICYFPSQEFYGGKLITARSSSWMSGYRLSLWPRKEIPHVFCHVEGTEEALSVSTDEGNEQSKFNHEEAQKVCDIFKWMIEKERINGDKINMMSQYNAQCSKIKQNLEMYFDKNRTCINVNTVVASQGGEWDYVIFSTVRSLPEYKIEKNPTFGWSKQNLGFITDANQINVALTRARKGLIIIGNKHLLKSDKVLGKLITNYQEQGCLVDGKKFPKR